MRMRIGRINVNANANANANENANRSEQRECECGCGCECDCECKCECGGEYLPDAPILSEQQSKTKPLRMQLSVDEAKRSVDGYRRENTSIQKFPRDASGW